MKTPLTYDNTIALDVWPSLYLSSRYLQELEIALRSVGIRTRYERPGLDGIVIPRLYVEHPEHGELSQALCATPLRTNSRGLEWWFEWRSFTPCDCSECIRTELERICRIGDMSTAAQLIAQQLYEESA